MNSINEHTQTINELRAQGFPRSSEETIALHTMAMSAGNHALAYAMRVLWLSYVSKKNEALDVQNNTFRLLMHQANEMRESSVSKDAES